MRLTCTEFILEALVNKRYSCLRIPLEPFCFDHWVLLSGLKSSLLYGGSYPTPIDMTLAIKACASRSNEEFFRWCERPSLLWQLWARGVTVNTVPVGLKTFNTYIEDHFPKMEIWQSKDAYEDTGDQRCPGVFLSVCKLVNAGHDFEKVRRMSLGVVRALGLGIHETSGEDCRHIMTDLEVEVSNFKDLQEKEALNA